MTLLDWVDLVRVDGAFIALLLLFPLAARRLGGRSAIPWQGDVAPSFVYASLFFQIAGFLLGNWRLCYPGLMGVVTLFWLAVTIVFASRRRWIWDEAAWRRGFLRALEWFESKSWRPLLERGRKPSTREITLTGTAVLFVLWLVAVFLSRAAFAFDNFRFLGAQTYERALSLQTMVNGGIWAQDGSVALLAAVAHLSGADGATVVRLTGPIFLLLLVLAGAYCAWVYTRRPAAAFLAAWLLGVYPAVLGFDSPGEAAGPEIAAIYWLLALALLRHHWRYAAASSAVAYLVYPQFTPLLAGALACVTGAVLLGWLAELAPKAIANAVAVGLVVLGAAVLVGAADPPQAGPYQYESAAKAASRIARSYPRNKWMIVSPAQEVASTYGRGWHLQISDFVRDHQPETVGRPEFRFRYPVEDLFVFIEKEPLRQVARGAATADDRYAYVYFTQTGRSSLQFEAARIMAAYCAAHENAEPYFEDDQLIVYRVSLKVADASS